MSYERYNLHLAFLKPVDPALSGQLNAFGQLIRLIKPFAVNINEGKPNEENTTIAKRHICHHDEESREPCVEEDI